MKSSASKVARQVAPIETPAPVVLNVDEDTLLQLACRINPLICLDAQDTSGKVSDALDWLDLVEAQDPETEREKYGRSLIIEVLRDALRFNARNLLREFCGPTQTGA